MVQIGSLICILSFVFICISFGCETKFDGFGVHLGSIGHLDGTNEQTVRNVIEKLYFQLQLRLFRTSYEPYFSESEGVYNIKCDDSVPPCRWSWVSMLKIMSEPPYNQDSKFMASIWSPPYYMKDPELVRLKPEFETRYLYFIRNITQLIQDTYGIEIERISPVNEPENVFAPWDHCNMDPHQICRIIRDFNDTKISLCPENSYFWITNLFTAYKNPSAGINCQTTCEVIATHAYALNVDPTSENFLSAYYDLYPYKANYLENKRIWQTEVSSTYKRAGENQMKEGLDLATNIINFVGTTCVERYYFWIAFTTWASGESLIWGTPNPDNKEWNLTFPKKFHIFNHFTNASVGGNKYVNSCTGADFMNGNSTDTKCLKFDSTNTVFLNKGSTTVHLNPNSVDCNLGLCCTTEQSDLVCATEDGLDELPPSSVCTCKGVWPPAPTTLEPTESTSEPPKATTPDSSSAAQTQLFVKDVCVMMVVVGFWTLKSATITA